MSWESSKWEGKTQRWMKCDSYTQEDRGRDKLSRNTVQDNVVGANSEECQCKYSSTGPACDGGGPHLEAGMLSSFMRKIACMLRVLTDNTTTLCVRKHFHFISFNHRKQCNRRKKGCGWRSLRYETRIWTEAMCHASRVPPECGWRWPHQDSCLKARTSDLFFTFVPSSVLNTDNIWAGHARWKTSNTQGVSRNRLGGKKEEKTEAKM